MAQPGKTLMLFYSMEGSTAFIAKAIANAIGADLLELRLKKLLPSGSLKFVIGGMYVILKKKPELLPLEKNPVEYARIFLGTPVWAGNFTPPIRTLLATTKLTGKQIACFCCCADNPGKTLESLQRELSGNAWLGGISFRETMKDAENNAKRAREWAQEMITK